MSLSSTDMRSEATSVERAYEALLAMARDFAFKPGERLNEVGLAKRFEMSRVPLREALNRLASEGLLSAIPNQGFWARKLSASEITALLEVRADLEAAAAIRAIERGDDAELEDLLRFAERTFAGIGTSPLADLVASDEEFHMRVAEIAGNAERAAMLRNINVRIRFARQINLENPERLRASLAEHVAVARALKDRDSEAAARLVREHLSLSAEEAAAVVERGLARIYAESIR